VTEVCDRADLLAARLRNLADDPAAADLAARVAAAGAAIGSQARTFEQAEADALARFGDHLYAEEDLP
jgi:hypothetical protein